MHRNKIIKDKLKDINSSLGSVKYGELLSPISVSIMGASKRDLKITIEYLSISMRKFDGIWLNEIKSGNKTRNQLS